MVPDRAFVGGFTRAGGPDFRSVVAMSLVKELWSFMRVRKKWWLLPVLVVLVAVSALLVFAQGSALAPFIYTIF